MAVKSNYFGYIFSLQYTFLKLMTLCSIDLLLELAECFDVSTDYLLTGKEHCSRQTGERLQHVMDDLATIIRDLA